MLYGVLHRGEGGVAMATQEERLQKLEYDFTQFKADAIQSHQDMAMQFTMVRGLTGDIVERLKTFKQDTDEQLSDIKQDIGEFYVRFDRLDRHVTSLDKKTDQRFTALEEKFDQRFTAQESKTDQRFTALENKLEQRFTSLDSRFDSMLHMLAALTKKIAD